MKTSDEFAKILNNVVRHLNVPSLNFVFQNPLKDNLLLLSLFLDRSGGHFPRNYGEVCPF